MLLALLYWLNPWQLYFASFLWNPNYLFLFGALHLWSASPSASGRASGPPSCTPPGWCWRSRSTPSFLLLAVASLLLWLRRFFRVHWTGAILGGLVAALPLVPWAIEVAAHPAIVTEASKGFLGRGLILVFPLARGLLYWLRYASLSVAGRIGRLQLLDLLGSDPWLGPGSPASARGSRVTLVIPAAREPLSLAAAGRAPEAVAPVGLAAEARARRDRPRHGSRGTRGSASSRR